MYDFKTVEEGILDFWTKNEIYSKVKAKIKGKKRFYYLDGPPYTSGRIHLGHAWGKALRDSVMRYKRMKGFDVWDRAGFDMHGLPTEHAVEKKLGIKDKDDIEKLGVLNYVNECEKLSKENLKLMIEDFKRIGVWMDFDNPYMPINNSYIEGVWWLVKRAHEKKRLYEGLRTMHWCASCATSLAKHELEYDNITDKSIFLKFKIKGKDNEYLLIWTTTPWTIWFNLGVMVNPEIDYVKVKVDNEKWIIAKTLSNLFISGVLEKKFIILEEFKGDKLEGLKYEHPFSKDIKAFDEIESEKLHTIVLSHEYVDASSGTGLVHMAPGCGPEDYEVGHKNNLPPFNEVDDKGCFKDSMGEFKGLRAKLDDKKFIELLDKKGVLLASKDVEHEYAHCERCHNPVVFRTTKQWFFRVEDLKDEMKRLNEKVHWVPDWAGSRQFHDWLDNLRDNSITKQRYWGTPLPVWKCFKCSKYEVIGSVSDLKKFTKHIPSNLHKPWIDEVEFSCKCGGKMKRIPDVIDVWVDAGCASWLCLDYPVREDLFKDLYPADFIVEGKDQIRGWFNILLVASMIAFGNHPYKAVYMHGFINDSKGRKMSKSLQNYILPGEVVDKYGADTLRYYMMGGTKPGVDINYNFEDAKVKFRNLGILLNLCRFVIDLGEQNKFNKDTKPKEFSIEEKYILSRLNHSIKKVTLLYEDYNLEQVPWVIEECFLDLSRKYIQIIRDKASTGSEEEKKQVFYVCFRSLLEILKMFSTVSPFISEHLYLKLKEKFSLEEESISLFDWCGLNEELIDVKLEEEVDIAFAIIQSGLALRDKEKINVRWPLSKAIITSKYKIENVLDIIKSQLNVKDLEILEGELNVELDTKLTKELEEEGFFREVTRRVQALRREAKLQKKDFIELGISIDLRKFEDQIKDKCGVKKLEFKKGKYKFNDKFNVRGKEVEVGLNIL